MKIDVNKLLQKHQIDCLFKQNSLVVIIEVHARQYFASRFEGSSEIILYNSSTSFYTHVILAPLS
jgi:hypothetical protein